MDKFIYWFKRNYTPIIWFLIGWLVQASLVHFSRGDYLSALIDLFLAYFNYFLYSRRL